MRTKLNVSCDTPPTVPDALISSMERKKVMAIARGFAATAMFAGLALELAASASAAPVMSGRYIETQIDTSTGQPITSGGQPVTNDWYFTPCGDGCASVAMASGGQPFGQAHLANGQWTLDSVDEVACRDGGNVASALSNHRTWDPNTLSGTLQATYKVPACGHPVGYGFNINIQFRPAASSSSQEH